MFADTDFAEFLLWLIDDLPPKERRVWWSWLQLYTCYRVCVARLWSDRFSVN